MEEALGKKGKVITDILIFFMQLGFVIALSYFAITSMKSVMEAILDKPDIDILYLGLGIFVLSVPFVLVRRMEKFAFTHMLADILIFTTAIMILIFAILHVKDNGWGKGIQVINESTWLTMIGSAIFSYEGIGTVLPILEVTEKPKDFPRILLYVLITNMVLYTGFGEFCMFVYGN